MVFLLTSNLNSIQFPFFSIISPAINGRLLFQQELGPVSYSIAANCCVCVASEIKNWVYCRYPRASSTQKRLIFVVAISISEIDKILKKWRECIDIFMLLGITLKNFKRTKSISKLLTAKMIHHLLGTSCMPIDQFVTNFWAPSHCITKWGYENLSI